MRDPATFAAACRDARRALRREQPRLLALLDQFERATRADEFKGAAHPSDFGTIADNFDYARLALLTALASSALCTAKETP